MSSSRGRSSRPCPIGTAVRSSCFRVDWRAVDVGHDAQHGEVEVAVHGHDLRLIGRRCLAAIPIDGVDVELARAFRLVEHLWIQQGEARRSSAATWALVRMSPSASMMEPEPQPASIGSAGSALMRTVAARSWSRSRPSTASSTLAPVVTPVPIIVTATMRASTRITGLARRLRPPRPARFRCTRVECSDVWSAERRSRGCDMSLRVCSCEKRTVRGTPVPLIDHHVVPWAVERTLSSWLSARPGRRSPRPP